MKSFSNLFWQRTGGRQREGGARKRPTASLRFNGEYDIDEYPHIGK
jgi:hypothetical protein